ncbi:MAG: M1 family metallopeptidase [Cyclobacteriaceae bacterium]
MPYQHWFRIFGMALWVTLIFSCKPLEVPKSEKALGEEEKPSPNVMENIMEDSLSVLLKRKELLAEKEYGIQQYRTSRQRDFDLIHTSLQLQFDYENRQVSGKAQLSIKPYFYDQEQLILDARDFEIHQVWMEENNDTLPLAFNYNQEKLKVFLPGVFTKEDTLKIGIEYTAMPEEGADPVSGATSDTKGLYFINSDGLESNKPVQIWTQGETENSSKWFPTIDSPNERQTHDIQLRINQDYLSLSNGELIHQTSHEDGTRTDHWRMDLPHAPYLSAIVIGKFAEVKDNYGDLQVNYYVEEKFRKGAEKVFGNTPEMIRFFSDILGMEFPWKKYDQVVVRDFVSGAMENTTLSIFMEALNLDEREALDSEWDYIIAHELFHQWFGNYVTTESWSNLPLNESFADYSEYLWFEHKEGKDQADIHHFNAMEQYFEEAMEKQVNMIRFYYDDKEDMFDSHSYAKGGRILHMLRQLVGDEAFFKSLNLYLTSNAFSSVEIHHLRLAFEEITGKDLNWFFNQWFLDAGHPTLEILWDDLDPDNLLLTIRQKQELEDTPLYRLPFKVGIYKNGIKTEKEFILENGFQQFAIENGENTDFVIFDEGRTLLAEQISFRGKERLSGQFKWSKSGLARVEALDSLTTMFSEETNFSEIIMPALNDSFHVVRELVLHRLSTRTDHAFIDGPIEEKILNMAEEDPRNAVRAGAIEVLANLAPLKYETLFYRLINEPSYQIAGAALTSFMDLERNGEKKQEIFDRLKDEENIRILAPLADFLTEGSISVEEEWFHEKLHLLTGESLYYFLGYYGDYFASVEETSKQKAVENLYDLGKDHRKNYVRFAAFQSLFGFIDENEVLEKAIVLWQGEKDEQMKLYMQYYLEPYLDKD